MMSPRETTLAVLLTFVAIGQIVLTIILYSDTGNDAVRNIGWVILWVSAIFGWVPIITFKRSGGVAKGKSYVHTTQLVDSGLYSIVRHPQYLAGMLMGVGLAFIAQHWVVMILGAAAVVILYISTFGEEERATEKFGNDYLRYAQRVPRVNFLLGIIRVLRRRAAGRR
jgi:protein-S-isoprenylcysteine O-methyltransferase Ste14